MDFANLKLLKIALNFFGFQDFSGRFIFYLALVDVHLLINDLLGVSEICYGLLPVYCSDIQPLCNGKNFGQPWKNLRITIKRLKVCHKKLIWRWCVRCQKRLATSGLLFSNSIIIFQKILREESKEAKDKKLVFLCYVTSEWPLKKL